MKAPFLPHNAAGRRAWLQNFSGKLPKYSATVGVTDEEVTQTAADYVFFDYVCNAHQQHAKTTTDWTRYKNAAATGTVLGDLPTTPVLGTPPAAVPPGIFRRAAMLAARIKKHPGYTEPMGADLSIIGAEQVIDLNSLKPQLKITLRSGQPNLGWIKQGMDGLEILVDRNDGKGFVFLAFATIPDYLDNAPLPAPGTSAVWKYKAIYRLSDERAGEWSDVATISVMG